MSVDGAMADGPGSYGDRHAAVYDRIYGDRFAPEAAVDAIAAAAGDGAILELGLGTGRLALPLVARGFDVDGIEASSAMAALLSARPGARRVGVIRADLADFDLERHDYAVAVCAVSTLFMLPGPSAQQACVRASAAHLRPGGQLFIEAFRPDPTRFDERGQRTETRPTVDGSTHRVRSRHDATARTIHIVHELGDDSGSAAYEVTLHYASTAEIDAMATAAGLVPVARWHDWGGAPASEASTDPVSVYVKPV
jgi:SAM-dependent methyltransferase